MDFLEFTLSSKEWGLRQILRPVPTESDSWGILAPLKETPLKDFIPEVSGEAMSHALHGHIFPLMRQIGPDPQQLLRRAGRHFPDCVDRNTCVAKTDKCTPCPKLPDCFTPEGLQETDQLQAVVTVLLAWRDNRHVVVVIGEEFSIR